MIRGISRCGRRSASRKAAISTANGDSDDFPRVLVVTFQHPTPYFDDSYAVNSVNVGPYGDAIMQELIPEVEKRFRAIGQPWARWLSGGSTGGWESLALQVYHPDFFGGTWSLLSGPGHLHQRRRLDIYKDANASTKERVWVTVPTPNSRETNGGIRTTSARGTTSSWCTERRAGRASRRTSGRPSSARSASMAISSRCSTSGPVSSITPWRSTGAITSTCSNT